MLTIRIVSWIHMIWGWSMVYLGFVPRPFGSLEPFLVYMEPRSLGVLLVFMSTLTMVTAYRPKWFQSRPWIVPLAAAPQQFALVWGVVWAALHLASYQEGLDRIRTWYGCSYLTVLAIFHAKGLYLMYKAALVEMTERKHAGMAK